MKLTKWIILALMTMFDSACGDEIVENYPTSTVTGDNVSIVFVIDSSGSMSENIPNANGKSTPKIDIANDSLITVGQSLDQYLKTGSNKTVGIGFVRFYSGSVKPSHL